MNCCCWGSVERRHHPCSQGLVLSSTTLLLAAVREEPRGGQTFGLSRYRSALTHSTQACSATATSSGAGRLVAAPRRPNCRGWLQEQHARRAQSRKVGWPGCSAPGHAANPATKVLTITLSCLVSPFTV